MCHAGDQEQSRPLLWALGIARREALVPVGQRSGSHRLIRQAVIHDHLRTASREGSQHCRIRIVDCRGLIRADHVAIEIELQGIERGIRRRQ